MMVTRKLNRDLCETVTRRWSPDQNGESSGGVQSVNEADGHGVILRGPFPLALPPVRNHSSFLSWRAYVVIGASLVIPGSASAQSRRAMTFLDVQNMRQVGTPDLSTDGRWLLYTLSVPDWKEARRQSDIFIVSTDRGVSTTRQLTYTKDKTETQPRWSRDGSFFVFASDRDASA